MSIAPLVLGILAGAALGALLVVLLWRGRLAEQKAELARLETTLAHERSRNEEKLALLANAEERFKDAFKALSAEALTSSSESFLKLADQRLAKQQSEARGELDKRKQAVESLVDPIAKALESVRKQLDEVEKRRAEDYGGLSQHLKSFAADQEKLRRETANLAQALRKPSVRGRWGEIQLRRVVEMAGMLSHCDFHEQAAQAGEAGARRPDLVVHLPAGKQVVVDAKTPLEAYLDALECEEEADRQALLGRHAHQVRDHIAQLGRKTYWDQFETSPEFVVMFLPSESVFYAALEQDPSLIEKGVDQRVILATPTTLIALLRAVHYGWQQEVLAENAQRISELGRELYERLATLTGHFRDLGRKLDGAVDSYNRALGSLESRVLVSARRFPELGISPGRELPELSSVDRSARRLSADFGEDDAGERAIHGGGMEEPKAGASRAERDAAPGERETPAGESDAAVETDARSGADS